MKIFLENKIDEKYELVIQSPVFITRAPNRRLVDVRKLKTLKEAEQLAKEGYLKKRELKEIS